MGIGKIRKKRPKCGLKKSFNSSVDLSNVVLQEWQKEALKQANQKSNHSGAYKKDRSRPAQPVKSVPPSPVKRKKTEEELKAEIEEKKKSLKSAMRIFDTNAISSDE